MMVGICMEHGCAHHQRGNGNQHHHRDVEHPFQLFTGLTNLEVGEIDRKSMNVRGAALRVFEFALYVLVCCE